jgi:hypothetical protein
MKLLACTLLASLMLLPGISLAQTSTQTTTQTTLQEPASWTAFQKQEQAKRADLFKQLNADKEAFLKANPDVQTYLNQVRTAAQARAQAWKAAHQKTTTTTSSN